MNRKIIISLSVIGIVAAIAIGGTVAFFSDTETSTGNTFTAGTLNLKVGDDDPTTWSYYAGDIKPGDEDKEFVTLQNTGSIDGYLHITFANLVNDEMGCTEPEGDVDSTCDNPGENKGELAENLDILFYLDENTDDNFNLGIDTLIYQGKAKGILQGDLFNYYLASGNSREFVLERKLGNSVGNIIQTDSTQFDVVFELTQNQKEIVGDWHFDENNGTIAYDSAFSPQNNGTLTNGPVWADGKYNPALGFDGINDYVSVNDSPSLDFSTANGITIEAWIFVDTWGNWKDIVFKGDSSGSNTDFQLALVSTGFAWDGTLNGNWRTKYFNTPQNTGQWIYVAVTHDTNIVTCYRDGVSIGSQVDAGNIYHSPHLLAIGREGTQNYGYFDGKIDEVRIYNRVLSAEEILAHYQAGL